MLDIYRSLVRELAAGSPAVIGRIIRQSGSSPRSLGTKFLVRSDGSIVGTIGGGSLEARVIAAALELMGDSKASVLEIKMTGEEVAKTDMICGGRVDVLVQGFTPDDHETRTLLESVIGQIEKGGRGVLAMGPLPKPGIAGQIGLAFGETGLEAGEGVHGFEALADILRKESAGVLQAEAVRLVDVSGLGQVVLEPLSAQARAIIFGGGHISVCLAPLLSLVDFKVIIVEDRAEFATTDRFPQAERLVVPDFMSSLDRLDFNAQTYIVIVTRGHLHDKAVLAGVIHSPVRYIGMIGSRRKRNMVYQALVNEGVSEERLAMVHSPVGLDIRAETPAEIAVSIAAELIKVRAEGLPLRTKVVDNQIQEY